MSFISDKLSGEKALFVLVVVAGYLFSIIDSLFFGYYLWIFFGPYFFLLYFFCSVPFVFINRLNNYSRIYEVINLSNIANKVCSSPWLAAAQILLLMILGYLTYNLYVVYYGSWVIQILKLLRNKMGFSGMEWIRILVFTSLIPEALSFCLGLFNNIKNLIRSVSANIKSITFTFIVKNFPYVILSIMSIAGAMVLSQISASYIMLTYQQYLMEFYKMSVPTIKNKASILFVIFVDVFFTIKQFFESTYKTYEKKDLMKLKDNYYSYVILCFTIFIRAISKIVLVVGIATSPWHINIKISTFLQSMFDDLLSINNSDNSYAKEIVRFAILFSLLNVFLYIALISSGHIQISLAYTIISVAAALALSLVTPTAIYYTNNSMDSTSSSALQENGRGNYSIVSKIKASINNGVTIVNGFI